MLVVAIVPGVLATVVAGTAGCARDTDAGGGARGGAAAAGDWTAVDKAEVYVQVLRRYLSTPADSSFSQRFKTVYILDQAYADAGDSRGQHEQGTAIAPNTQQQVTAALAGVAKVTFIADRDTVVETRGGCMQVKGDSILVTLGTMDGDDNEVRVGINGFAACDGATWLTYVVRNRTNSGWQVAGTTGSRAIA
ncbi:hypothetical protein ACTMS0_04350 [Micromonospora sp. H33]|uniref:hypothetical protein n=1 Tax=Micromonospora sp. H33 TaxID=3452215 RepID=UPI003F8A32F0